jgi:hypothetical protein
VTVYSSGREGGFGHPNGQTCPGHVPRSASARWEDERQERVLASSSWSSERATVLATGVSAGCPVCFGREGQRRHLPLGAPAPTSVEAVATGRCLQRGSRLLQVFVLRFVSKARSLHFGGSPSSPSGAVREARERCSNPWFRFLCLCPSGQARELALGRRDPTLSTCSAGCAGAMHFGVSVVGPGGRHGNVVRCQESEGGRYEVLGAPVPRMACNNKKATAPVMGCGCWRGVFFEGCEPHCGEEESSLGVQQRALRRACRSGLLDRRWDCQARRHQNAVNPMTVSGAQQTRRSARGRTRRGGEKPRGRLIRRLWQVSGEGRLRHSGQLRAEDAVEGHALDESQERKEAPDRAIGRRFPAAGEALRRRGEDKREDVQELATVPGNPGPWKTLGSDWRRSSSRGELQRPTEQLQSPRTRQHAGDSVAPTTPEGHANSTEVRRASALHFDTWRKPL